VMSEEKISRRRLLKYAGAGVVAVAAVGAGAYFATRPSAPPTTTQATTQVSTTMTSVPMPTSSVGEKFYATWCPFGPAVDPLFKNLAEDFATKNGVALTWDVIDWADYDKRLLTMFMGGQAPDALYDYSEIMPLMVDGGYLEPLDDRFAAWEESKHFFKAPFKQASYKGKIYGIPILGGEVLLYYNKAVLDKYGASYPTPDWTWDDFKAACEKVRDGSGGEVESFVAPFADWPELNYTWWPFFWQAGGSFLDDEANPTKCTVNSSAGVEALQWLRDLVDTNIISKSDIALVRDQGIEVFKKGAAFVTEQPWKEVMIAEAPEVYKNLGVQPMISGKAGKYTFGAFDYLSLSSISKDKDLAWKYIQYFTGADIMYQYEKASMSLPTRDDVPNPAPDSAGMTLAMNYIETAKKVPPVKNGSLILSRMAKDIQSCLLGQMSAKEALDDAANYGTEQMFSQ
jgi:multiple sugar transport system substrate-binding protein